MFDRNLFGDRARISNSLLSIRKISKVKYIRQLYKHVRNPVNPVQTNMGGLGNELPE